MQYRLNIVQITANNILQLPNWISKQSDTIINSAMTLQSFHKMVEHRIGTRLKYCNNGICFYGYDMSRDITSIVTY